MYLVIANTLIDGYGIEVSVLGLFTNKDRAEAAIEKTRDNLVKDPNFISWYKQWMHIYENMPEPREWLNGNHYPMEFKIKFIKVNDIYDMYYEVGDLHQPESEFCSVNGEGFNVKTLDSYCE